MNKKIEICKLEDKKWYHLIQIVHKRNKVYTVTDIIWLQQCSILYQKESRPATVFLSKADVFDNDTYQDHELKLNLYPSFFVLRQSRYTSNQFLKALPGHT